MFNTLNVCTNSFLSFSFICDPLEQFDVLSVAGLGILGATNLSLLLAINTFLIGVWFAMFNATIQNTYDFVLNSLNQLVRSIVQENLYIKKQQFFTILFYLFMTLLFANVVGMVPYSFTITSSFVVTFFLALMHFIGLNIIATVKHGWNVMELFLPSGAPLAIAPFLILIEAVSYVARVFSLSIRLFANMMSGHALLKILIGFSWALLTSGTVLIVISIFPWMIVTAIMFLELLIAFLQAYVFSILITLYINDVLNMHD